MKKPKILLLPDVPGWAYDFCADEIMRYLGDRYKFEKKFLKDVPDVRPAEYDVVFDFCSSLSHFVKKFRDNKKTIASIRSYVDIKKYAKHYTFHFLNTHYTAISILCEGMRYLIPQDAVPIFYTPLGVDASLFRPMSHKHEFTVGFAGKCRRPSKRFNLVKKAAHEAGVRLHIADRGQFSHVEMPHFYKKIDCYICMSEYRSEGGPNSVIEAASCGKAIVSTDVGVVSDIIKQKEGGILVPFEDVDALVSAIKKLKNDRDLCKQMGEQNRQTALKGWTWEQQVKNYEKLFDFVLENN
jgi:glycosyltransferase involved in cell wall biosynthesis